MTKRSISISFFAIIALFILLVDSVVVRTAESNDWLVYALLFDFMLVVPLLYWLLVVRRSGKKITALLPLPMLGAFAAWLVLPAGQKSMVWHGIWPIELLIFMAEAAIIVYEIRLVLRLILRFKQLRAAAVHPGEAIREATVDVLGVSRLASIIAHDASMIYYLFFSWKRRRKQEHIQELEGEHVYTYHRETNQVLLAAFATKLIVIESVVVHLLLMQWSHVAAWIVSVSELWLLALLWADCRASVLRPIRLERDRLRLRYGLRVQADIPLSAIAEAECSTEGYKVSRPEWKEAIGTTIGQPNVKLTLASLRRVEGLLFLPRSVRTIYLSVDQPQQLVKQLNAAMNGSE